MITPRLPLATRSFPRDSSLIGRVLQKAFGRYKYLQTDQYKKSKKKKNQNGAPPPVEIVVMGGSVTAGINCYTGVKGADIAECAWPTRLETLLNRLAGGRLVEVSNLAVSGSNTKTAEAILEYELMRMEDRDPDILINAYSTNDMHIMTITEAKEGHQSLRDKVFDMSQSFVRKVYTKRRCNEHTPLLLWLDDYIGNEQREILATTELSQGIQVLSNYYGFGFVSYADMVRDWVYGDTHEGLFSPARWYKNGKYPNRMHREIHPGQGMHMATAWMIAYYLSHLAVTYCSLEAWNIPQYEASLVYNSTEVQGLPKDLKGDYPLPTRPSPRPDALPPPLDAKLGLQDVSQRWQRAAVEARQTKQEEESRCSEESHRVIPKTKCPLSWVSGLDRDPSRASLASIQKYFDPFLLEGTNGWMLLDDTGRKDKFGWVAPSGSNVTKAFGEKETMGQLAPFRLTIECSHVPVHTVTFFFLKSYGAKWENSTAQVLVEVQSVDHQEWQVLDSLQLHGFHDKNTSEMYTEQLKLSRDVLDAQRLRISFFLVSGTTFKLMGIAVCN